MLKRVLIANRGEIAVRIARTAADLGIDTVAVYATDDTTSLHGTAATIAVPLAAAGARAYLDMTALLQVARETGCDAVHPGYGFLSENASFADACRSAGLIFVGPAPETLRALGDKARARSLARDLGIRVPAGSEAATSLEDIQRFFATAPAAAGIMIKAVAGGGGRGIRIVQQAGALAEAFERCRSEAFAAFGNGDVYCEALLADQRHIEVQIVGDGTGAVVALGERECSLQRRQQKLVEMAPSPSLLPQTRTSLLKAATALASSLRYEGLGTFEFLVDAEPVDGTQAVTFIEANPRLQVEHTVTERAYGCDLVELQLRIAGGAKLSELDLATLAERPPRRMAMQLRINAEVMQRDGSSKPTGGRIEALRLPGGPGVRVDTHVTGGTRIGTAYDSLVAKIIVDLPAGAHERLVAKAARALGEFDAVGIETNAAFLAGLLADPAVRANAVTTRFVDDNAARLVEAAERPAPNSRLSPAQSGSTSSGRWTMQQGTVAAPLLGSVVSVAVEAGARIKRGATLAVIEAMKMEHLFEAPTAGIVRVVHAAKGDVVEEGQPLFEIDADEQASAQGAPAVVLDLGHIRADLQAVIDAHTLTLDANRPDAVARRHKTGMRMVRENLDDLLDPGSFIEYGALAVAAQRARRSLDDLKKNTPADGLVTGIGTVNAAHTTPEKARVAVMAYDYTVLAGTQGKLNHKKSDRLLQVVGDWKIPMVMFAEGGGGRPGDTDAAAVAGLDTTTFSMFARLSGVVPRVGIVAGRCFAGNAALLGSGDVIIATRNSSIGMGGPAMIEGGGLGVVAADDVGPASVQAPNGVIDVLVEDEAAAVAATKQYLGYVQGERAPAAAVDQRTLRHLVPENRVRVYEMRGVIEALADAGSVLELRRDYGVGAITAFVRIEGKPFGLIANNPKHLGGAIDGPASDKLARFLQLCDAYALPIVSLCDTPGFMVGPQSETTATVRKTSRLFVTGAALRVPMFTVVLRKGYGLGAMAMAAGAFHAPFFIVGWPTSEYGGMGLEGAVRLGYRKELEAAGPDKADALFKELVAKSYERGRAINMASFLEIDAVIDPADTRRWLLRGLASVPANLPPRRPFIDTW